MPITRPYFLKIQPLTLWLLIMFLGTPLFSQYIHQVIEYKPAPGQFINKPPFGDPNAASSIVGTLEGALSLGAFGGYVVFSFEHPVQNHPDNPYGIDFIIFGNPMPTFSESAIVSVMKDENGNGLPDDTWYELAGSDYFFSNTLHHNQVTYLNPGAGAADVPWSDQFGNQGLIKAHSFHTQPYYPLYSLFPAVDSLSQTYTGTRIMGKMDHSNPGMVISRRRAFGYADNRPRGTAPFTLPGNPYIPTIENAGGDGFDISWAVDADGNYVDLDEIHFIRVHTAMQDNAGWLGEISAEITGAVVVSPQPGITGITQMVVIEDLPQVISQTPFQLKAIPFDRGRVQPQWQISWSTDMEGAYVDENQLLHLPHSGNITITASLTHHTTITASATVRIDLDANTSTPKPWLNTFRIYPNPATHQLVIEGAQNNGITLYNIHGQSVMKLKDIQDTITLDISFLSQGLYLLKIVDGPNVHTVKFLKK